MKNLLTMSGIVLVLVMAAGAAFAQPDTMLDFTGLLYESDNTPGAIGFPPSDVGDVLAGGGFIQNINPALPWTLDDNEFTFFMSDLVSTGQIDIGGGILQISYTGGTLAFASDLFADGGFTAADYGIDPPNATMQSTFMDGTVVLSGEFTSFSMTFNPATHTGNFEGTVTWTGGADLIEVPSDGYTFAGTVDATNAQIPEGYDLETVGHVNFDPSISVEPSAWGDVKALFR